MNRTGRFALALAASTTLTSVAYAQPPVAAAAPAHSAPNNAPVNFVADQIVYDKTGNIVTATGHVHALQNGQSLFADKVVLNRTTNVATATGHVILIQPDGYTVYAHQATLSQGMKDAVMEGVAARLAQNARMIANGARRYNGQIDEMSKVVYSACDLCKTNPKAPPLWQIRASSATRDLQHKMIEYRDATMEMDGFPVFYLPYMTQPDPSVKRQTGLLIPSIGVSSRLGAFAIVPYYIVINGASDITLTPIVASKEGPALIADYRHVFNNGQLTINASAGRDNGSVGNSVFSNGSFDLNQDWRAGFSYNRASDPRYLDDFSILPNASYLTSNVYLEGFSSGSYARLDAETYQGLVASVDQSELPIVAPHGQYHFISAQDSIGGQFSLDTDTFNVMRDVGTDSRRISAIPGYSVPFTLPHGILGTARIEIVAAAYQASHLNDQPNFSTVNSASTGRVQPYGAVYLHMPFIRQAGRFGSQIIEPEAQLVVSPNVGISQNDRIPNEDSLDLEFSDANLFDLNRYPGIDRLEGGSRVDYALHTAWYMPQGAFIDGLIGQSYRFHKDNDYLPESGLNWNVSDYVGRLVVQPTPFFNLIYRTRLDHDSFGPRMIDATANVGNHTLNFSGGYLYANTNPYVLYNSPSPISPTIDPPAGYFVPRHEITLSANTNIGQWSFGGGGERNIQTGQFDGVNANVGWQNNCFGVSVLYNQRFTSYNYDDGSTTVLIQFTFKTLGKCWIQRPMKQILCAGFVMASFGLAPALAQTTNADSTGIAAVVNGQVITTQDVAARSRLLAISTGMQATPQILARLEPQVTSQLIDQSLQLQEINRRNVVVQEADIVGAIAHIEQGNGLPAGGLRAKLTADGVPFDTLVNQLRIELGWQTVLHQVLGPGLQPTTGDMNAEKAALKAELGSTQYHISEIFIPVTDPANDAHAQTFANAVIAQLRTGAPFALVAAQFSQAQTALQGGDLGFVQLSQLDPAVAAVVTTMPNSAISNPIRVPGGYDIVQLQDSHKVGSDMQTMVTLRQAFAPYPTPITNGVVGPVQTAVIEKLVQATRNANSCADIQAENTALGNVQPSDPGSVNLATVTPPAFQTLLASLPIGKVSQPLVAQNGVSVVMVCTRQNQAEALPSDDQISQIIIERRVELESQQLLDDLRHRSIITQN